MRRRGPPLPPLRMLARKRKLGSVRKGVQPGLLRWSAKQPKKPLPVATRKRKR